MTTLASDVEQLLEDLPYLTVPEVQETLLSWRGRTGKFIVDAWIDQAQTVQDKRSIERFVKRIEDALRPDASWTDSDSD